MTIIAQIDESVVFFDAVFPHPVKPPRGRSGARPYEFRHAFAVHRLTAWAVEGADVHAKLPCVTFRRNGAGHFRRNDATGNEQLEGSNGDQGCLILPPFASSVLGDSTPGFSPR